MMRQILIVAALAGCGGSEDDSSFICEVSDRAGTYVLHYQERPNGTCGQPPDEVVRLDGGGGISPACTLDAPDSWSSDQCRLDRSITCCEGGFCTSLVGFTQQQDESGARISGVFTMQIQELGPLGTVIDGCVSTYDVTATRI